MSLIQFRKLIIPVGFLLGAVLIAGWLRATKSDSPESPRAARVWTVDTTPVVISDFMPELHLFAEIVSGLATDLRALVAGTVESVGTNFANGGVIEKGEVLLTMDPFFRDRDLVRSRFYRSRF